MLKGLQKWRESGGDAKDTAVLFRTRQEAGVLAELLVEYQIPFSMRDRLPNLYEHWIAKDYLSYLHLAEKPMRRQDFLRVMNRPNRYIARNAIYEKEVNLETLRIYYEDREWMCDRIDDLESDLKQICSLPPYGAINYLRHAVGYEGYLREYARLRGLDERELSETADQIQEIGRAHV